LAATRKKVEENKIEEDCGGKTQERIGNKRNLLFTVKLLELIDIQHLVYSFITHLDALQCIA